MDRETYLATILRSLTALRVTENVGLVNEIVGDFERNGAKRLPNFSEFVHLTYLKNSRPDQHAKPAEWDRANREIEELVRGYLQGE